MLLIATREEQKDTSEKMQDLGLMPLWQRELDVIKDDSKVLLSLGLFSFSLLLGYHKFFKCRHSIFTMRFSICCV